MTDPRASAPWRTIDKLPYIITQPGNYRLTRSLQAVSEGIVIQSSFVTIDGGGHELWHEGGSRTTRCGVISEGKQQHLTVRNLRLRGFYCGIRLSEDYDRLANNDPHAARRITVESIHVSRSWFRGIRLDACESIVRNCVVSGVWGTTLHRDAYTMGIETYGPANQIVGNTICEVYGSGPGEGVGICVSDFAQGTQVIGNRIRNQRLTEQGDFGIFVGANCTVYAAGNDIRHFQHGVAFTTDVLGIATLDRNRVQGCRKNYLLFGEFEFPVLHGTYFAKPTPDEPESISVDGQSPALLARPLGYSMPRN